VGQSKEKGPLGRPRLDGRIILNWILRKSDGGVDWIYLAQDRDR
jgi:transposase